MNLDAQWIPNGAGTANDPGDTVWVDGWEFEVGEADWDPCGETENTGFSIYVTTCMARPGHEHPHIRCNYIGGDDWLNNYRMRIVRVTRKTNVFINQEGRVDSVSVA